MYIGDLLCNSDFYFDAPVRILWNHDRVKTNVFDSTLSGDISPDLMMMKINNVKMGEDGVVEIEYGGYEL